MMPRERLIAFAAEYNANAAVDYAAQHWDDGVGACASFVSNCLKAGGCGAWSSNVTNLRNQLRNSGYGTEYLLTKSGQYIPYSLNAEKLSAGDPIFFFCSRCGKMMHVAICSGYNSAGNATAYAHNAPWNNMVYIGGFWDEYEHKGSDISIYSFHMSESSQFSTVSEGAYYLRNFYTNDYLAVADGKDVNGQDVRTFGFYPSTAYQFEVKQSTTTSGYALRPLCSSSRMLNVYADNVVSGKNVCIYNDTGDGTQRWYFEETIDGHILRVVQNPSCVLDVLDDHNVAVYTAHGGASQTWVLENSISYDANGGEGAPAMQMKTYGNSATLSATIPNRSGYTFLGWATSPTATAATYTVGGTFTANANTVLYAVWSKNTSTPMPPASTMCGDVDNSGKVDSTDARLVLQYVVKKITASSLNLTVADVDSDGAVNSTDARLILQYCVKKIDRLPVSKTENGDKDDTDKVDAAIESGKIYTLTNLASNKLLNVYGNKSANNTNVTIYDNDNTAGQYFQCVKNGDAYVLVPQCATGSALNVYGESATNNANVCIWEKTGHNTQAWELEYNSSANAYVLRSASNTDFVLAATGKANSDNVCLKTYAAGDTYQLWQFTEVKSSAESNDNALYSPVVSRRITSNFQPYYRQDYSNQWAHVGIDYVSSASDSTIYAFYGGTVSRVAYNASAGNYVELRHTYNGKTFYSYYFHLQSNSIRVSQGDTVTGGQPIATMGNTGDVTGVHLHFQITSSSVVNANGSLHTPENQSSYSGWSIERQAAEKSFTSTRGVVFYNPEKVLTQGLSIIG